MRSTRSSSRWRPAIPFTSTTGSGNYEEVAASHGLHNAQWAWGNVFFDYDNDGDRDVHVVNGMASNHDPRAKEAPDN